MKVLLGLHREENGFAATNEAKYQFKALKHHFPSSQGIPNLEQMEISLTLKTLHGISLSQSYFFYFFHMMVS